ncbi:peptidoglycan recognition protein family protein [Streptomyces sp. 2A115]|uniref:peptidoglycan recognition protein family protein n=1 Tax=Streptomyces sp. 2A115 TaxID=3457439 RepID=UPI003FD3D156
MKLVSRAQWGARAYRTPNGATPYSRARRGVKLHYLGTAYSNRDHGQCDDYVRQIQSQHMDGNGWSDIGYSFVVCTHGYVYEGRGLRRRNSANGNTTLNDQDYAVLLMVGSSGLTKPTDAQLHGARDAIDHCRTQGPAGTWLGGHRDGHATACPGEYVYVWAKAGAPRPAGAEPTKPVTAYKPPAFPTGLRPNSAKPSARGLQKVMKALGFLAASVPYADNYGPQTQEAVARFHNKHTAYRAPGLKHDTAIGPKGWAFAHTKAYGGK